MPTRSTSANSPMRPATPSRMRARIPACAPSASSPARPRAAAMSSRLPPPADAEAMLAQGAAFWPLRLARELDDAILHIRANEPDIAAIVFKSAGDGEQVLAYDVLLATDHWLAREIRLLWKRVLKRIDL